MNKSKYCANCGNRMGDKEEYICNPCEKEFARVEAEFSAAERAEKRKQKKGKKNDRKPRPVV